MERVLDTGSIVELHHVSSQARFQFMLDVRGHCVVLGDPAHTYMRLRGSPNGHVKYQPPTGKDSLWELEWLSESIVRLKSNNGPTKEMYLGCQAGKLGMVAQSDSLPIEDATVTFEFRTIAERPEFQLLETDEVKTARMHAQFTLSRSAIGSSHRDFDQPLYVVHLHWADLKYNNLCSKVICTFATC